MIVAQGGRFGGWSLYVKDGKLAYCYNWSGAALYPSWPTSRCRPAPSPSSMTSPIDGGEPGAGGMGTCT